MSSHLTPAECIDAMDGTLADVRLTHLQTCADCRAEVASLADTATAAKSGDVPEPSPLFWDHQAARIGAAVAAEEPQTHSVWISRLAWGGLVAAAAIAGLVVFVPREGPQLARATSTSPHAAEVSTLGDQIDREDQRAWMLVVTAGEGLDLDAAEDSLQPTSDTIDVAVQDLDSEEREALAALLRVQMKPRS